MARGRRDLGLERQWRDRMSQWRASGLSVREFCQRTRAACQPGNVKLIGDDTTELGYASHRAMVGLGPIGNEDPTFRYTLDYRRLSQMLEDRRCHVEERQYEGAARLDRMVSVTAIVAMRLLQLRSAAKETPEVPAETMTPKHCVELLRIVRKIPRNNSFTIGNFFRQKVSLLL